MAQDRMQRQRFELKYVIPEETALRLRPYLTEYLEIDEFGVGKPNFSYPVNSIYLDADRLTTFWNWVNADRNRFKLRVRFYDDQPHTPVFLELKRRVNGCILKERCGITKLAAPGILLGQFPPPSQIHSREPKHLTALQNFIDVTQRLHARPTMLVTYLREAYLSDNNSVRITFDRAVRMTPRTEMGFSLNPETYVEPFGNRVILEIKFTDRFPEWIGTMVRLFGLRRDGAAKYCEGVAAYYHPQLGNWSGRPEANAVHHRAEPPAAHELIASPSPH